MLQALGTVSVCGLVPIGARQLKLYRQNLAVSRAVFPPGPRFTATDRLLVLAPHCDDETLGVGGAIVDAAARGARVRVVFLTNGDGSRSTQIAEDARHLRRNTFRQIARMRQQEALAALARLGVGAEHVIFLGYPDGGTQAMWEKHWTPATAFHSVYTGTDRSPYANSRTPGAVYCGEQAWRDIMGVIADWQPTHVITTHPADTHPDHWAAYAYAGAALEALRLRPATASWARQTRLVTFLVHRGLWPAPHGYNPDAALAPPADLKDEGTAWRQLALSTKARAAKEAALECYTSQLAFTPQYLRGFLRRNELYGEIPVCETTAAQPAVMPHSSGGMMLLDPVHDSLMHEVLPGSDVRSVALRIGTASAVPWTIEVTLARAPTLRIHYRVALHLVTGSGIRAWTIDARPSGAAWQARLHNLSATGMAPVAAQPVPHGFRLTVPPALLELTGEPASLFISVGTYLGNKRFDQTETGIMRLPGPRR